MKGLFAQLYLDEDVSVIVASMLRSRHFTAITTVEAENRGKSDEHQLAYAASINSVLLTHNRIHFEKLTAAYTTKGLQHAGMIIAVRRAETEMVKRLLALLDKITAEEFENQVLYI